MSSSEADLLNVPADAGLDEIKKAYRKAALKHHPDHNPDPHAARHFRKLTDAYRLLSQQAAAREPKAVRRSPPPAERVNFLVADVRALLKRWPAQRWTKPTDGLPAVIWVSGALEVVANRWPGAPAKAPLPPNAEGVAAACTDLLERVQGWPLSEEVDKNAWRELQRVLDAAESRLRALERPPRRPA